MLCIKQEASAEIILIQNIYKSSITTLARRRQDNFRSGTHKLPTLDRLSRIGQPHQRCRSAQDAAGALRRAVAGVAPIARRTLV